MNQTLPSLHVEFLEIKLTVLLTLKYNIFSIMLDMYVFMLHDITSVKKYWTESSMYIVAKYPPR